MTPEAIRILVMVLLLVNMGQSVAAASKPQIVLTMNQSDDHPDSTWAKLVFSEVFERIGMEFVYKFYPLKRGVAMADAGEVDGILSRAEEFGALHPNLIRVPESFLTLNYCAFAIDPTIQVDGWESLRGTGYRIDYLRGTDVATMFLLQVVTPEQLTTLSDTSAGLKKLIAGRTDLFLDTDHNLMQALKAEGLKDAGIWNAGVLMEVPLYVYLYHTHADLVPKLAEVIKAIKAEGLIEKYRIIAYEE